MVKTKTIIQENMSATSTPVINIHKESSKKDNCSLTEQTVTSRSYPLKKSINSSSNSCSSSNSFPVQTNAIKKSDPKKKKSQNADWIGVEEVDDDITLMFELAESKIIPPKRKSKKSKTTKNDPFNSSSDCKHLETINENGVEICVNCSTYLYDKISHKAEWRYYGENDNQHSYDPSRCQYVKKAEKGIRSELVKMGFTPQIVDLADELYNKITNGDIKRSELRKGIEFACVFQAYKMIGKPIIFEKLQEIFKIPRKKLSKGLIYFNTNLPKDVSMNLEYITAKHYIPSIAEQFNIKKEHIDNILELFGLIENRCSSINTSTPQSVASGLVYYYLTKLNAPITAKKFGEEVSLSEITISKIKNEIEDILSS